ncbi:acetate--CoA ligase family protein (plasmid) [Aquicoccus sp. G2-2]|uniref:acetate--CoA ligase family protein n=1 Tax=Aquicoccus sp. G2-2 TaxID=3092120 RepID=UPI002AE029AB|nr:acetate--CoA ligase family protein [Aquicoccus sp. G2-2]MEA1111999.1 acetate--CoA ligase family protein [Aquicoccus sp. G2-2]
MLRDVTPLIEPRKIAVIGASSTKTSQGNAVIANLRDWAWPGDIIPVHPVAPEIDGLRTVAAVAELPGDVDTAIVAIPASGVLKALEEMEALGLPSANVFTNGFSDEDEQAFKVFAATSRMHISGPNCMGIINFPGRVPLYPSRPSLRLKTGRVSLIAQSGSAAISVLNTITVGVSKVITVGSEFQLSAADYVAWCAGDPETDVVGVVMESIKDPVAFAAAAQKMRDVGKPLVVLKVGASEIGAAATRAHTGALISPRDAYDRYFADCGIALVHDYDELVATLECFNFTRPVLNHGGAAIAGISGGQTALACDLAENIGLAVSSFADSTEAEVRRCLPGTNGANPIDIGAVVSREARNSGGALNAVLADDNVNVLAILQDSQDSLNPATLENYMSHIPDFAALGREAKKPVVAISPASGEIAPRIRAEFEAAHIPILRGLRPGLVAVRCLSNSLDGRPGLWARERTKHAPGAEGLADLRREISTHNGVLPSELSFRLLSAYGIPTVASAKVPDEAGAMAQAPSVGFPMVVKVSSKDIPHRSDIGCVVLDVSDEAGLKGAIATIQRNVAAKAPDARIDGLEMQAQVSGEEAMAGFAAAAPFGSMIVTGTGGVRVEIEADRAVGLAPLSAESAEQMIASTRMGKVLSGYRNLLPVTDTSAYADLLVRLSQLATDLGDLIGGCDLNPVLVTSGTGDVCVVDALMILSDTT